MTSRREPSSLPPSQELPILHPYTGAITINLHLYTGAVVRELTLEQYRMVYHEWNRSVLISLCGEVSSEVSHNHLGRRMNMPQNAHLKSCLVSNSTILFT